MANNKAFSPWGLDTSRLLTRPALQTTFALGAAGLGANDARQGNGWRGAGELGIAALASPWAAKQILYGVGKGSAGSIVAPAIKGLVGQGMQKIGNSWGSSPGGNP